LVCAAVILTSLLVSNAPRAPRDPQTFGSNMTVRQEPAITPYSGPDYTCVTFRPDLPRFGMAALDEDVVSLLSKRVYDMAGVLGKGVKVTLNGEAVPIKAFTDYVGLYVTDVEVHARVSGVG
jgi:DNA topoisomerase-2